VRFLAPKGSATLDGVSLTINEVDHALFTINIIPHTQNATTLGKLSIGDGVNFEVDLLARYIERLLQPQC
jgi:riboflavin synthase